MTVKIKIVYLYAEVMGYTEATLAELLDQGAEILLFHWKKNKISSFKPTISSHVRSYARDQLGFFSILKAVKEFDPEIIVVSGWMDKGYLPTCLYGVFRGKKVVLCLDDQWFGSLRQKFLSFISKIGVFQMFYNRAWVCGSSQFEYAKNMGIKSSQIAYDLYSANTKIFNAQGVDHKSKKNKFLFVGRFSPEKGLMLLIEAWRLLRDDIGDWTLTLVGEGGLDLGNLPRGIETKPFMSEGCLVEEAKSSSCFVLPSLFEPWGVVVHEFAALGLPLILSDAVGARTTFLVNEYNGYVFRKGDARELASVMRKMIRLTERERLEMSIASEALSQRISPLTSARNLLSLHTT